MKTLLACWRGVWTARPSSMMVHTTDKYLGELWVHRSLLLWLTWWWRNLSKRYSSLMINGFHDTGTGTWMTLLPFCIETWWTSFLGNLAEYYPALSSQMELEKKANWPFWMWRFTTSLMVTERRRFTRNQPIPTDYLDFNSCNPM